MAKLSVSLMPVAFASSRVQRVALLGVVGAGGVAGGGADAPVFFLDQFVVAESLARAEAPVEAGAAVELLGEGFGERSARALAMIAFTSSSSALNFSASSSAPKAGR